MKYIEYFCFFLEDEENHIIRSLTKNKNQTIIIHIYLFKGPVFLFFFLTEDRCSFSSLCKEIESLVIYFRI